MSHHRFEVHSLGVETRRDGEIVRLVDGAGFSLQRGEVLALVGPSGSGKSLTCAACLDVLLAGTWRKSGTVLLDGEKRTPSSLRGRVIATILQAPRSAFNPVRTMRDHARETLHAIGADLSSWEEQARAAMVAAGLADAGHILGHYPFEMSGGMLQRMMIALALMSRAPFLFADEPTTDLDLVVQSEILDLIDKLKRERGLGVLLVTHDIGVVARLADRVAVMDGGRIVETGPVGQMFCSPVHPTTCQLIDAHLALYGLERVA